MALEFSFRGPGQKHFVDELHASPGVRAGVQENKAFAAAAALDTHKALVHIFFAQRTTKKIRGVTDRGLKARPIKRIAVLGGGLMGSGIATACVLVGIEVVLKEINQKFLDVRSPSVIPVIAWWCQELSGRSNSVICTVMYSIHLA